MGDHPFRHRDQAVRVPGTWTDAHGCECVGELLLYPGSTGPTPFSPSASRASPQVRAGWTEAQRAHEEAAWLHLIEVDAAYWRSTGRKPEDVKRRRKAALQRYGRAAYPDEARERRISPALRWVVIAEWETAGRLCAICGQAVARDDAIQVHHVQPVVRGGTRARENLRVAHARCNMRYMDGRITWRLHHTAEEAPCAVCGHTGRGLITLSQMGVTRASIRLCDEHRHFPVAERLIDLDEVLGNASL